MSNALKFTERGAVTLRLDHVTHGWTPDHPVLSGLKSALSFSVMDTGIGIPANKQRIVFEMFQQADGTTSRKYGGTGLGLSISREIASLLGGEIRLTSSPGAGSNFTLYLPETYIAPAYLPRMEPRTASAKEQLDILLMAARPRYAPVAPMEVEDDRAQLQPGDRVLLIVEDDVTFARIMLDLAHDRGLKAIVALRGSTAIALAREFDARALLVRGMGYRAIGLDGVHGLSSKAAISSQDQT